MSLNKNIWQQPHPPITASFTSNEKASTLFASHMDSRTAFQNNLAISSQLTKMTSSLSVCLPEMEKLSATLLDWCRSVDQGFSAFQSELTEIKEDFSAKNVKMHEFHRTIGDRQQLSENWFQEKSGPRFNSIENRLDGFSEKIAQLQDQLFQKMTSVMEVQTNFTTVVNKLRVSHDEIHEELKKISEEHTRNIRLAVDCLTPGIDSISNRINEVQEQLNNDILAFDHAGLLKSQKECNEQFNILSQKVANLQMEYHENFNKLQQNMIALNNKEITMVNLDRSTLTNCQDEIHDILVQMKNLRTKVSDQPATGLMQEEISILRNRENEQDNRIKALETVVQMKVEPDKAAEKEITELTKEVHDLLRKVNVIFETVGTLRCELGNLKMQSETKLVPDYLFSSKRHGGVETATCSLGYENCFLSKSGLCTNTFHLPRKGHRSGFRAVDPPGQGVLSSGSRSNFPNQESFQSIVARNVVSLDETPTVSAKPNSLRNFSDSLQSV